MKPRQHATTEEGGDFLRMSHEEFCAWARSPFPKRDKEEFFPVHQIGPDGKRRARYIREAKS